MTEDALIRRAVPADAPQVRALTHRAYARWVPIMGVTPRPMEADHAAAIRDHRVDLLVIGGETVGLIELHDRAEDLLIESVALAPEWQGRRLGHRLLLHAESVATAGGRDTIRLHTNVLMTANIRLYESFGYATERIVDLPDRRVVHMVKRLTSAA